MHQPERTNLNTPSCNPRRPILGHLLRYFYGSPAAIRDGPFSETWLATSMAPQARGGTTMMTIDLFFLGEGRDDDDDD